jgi:NCAIR mutase (PurE)-related protein
MSSRELGLNREAIQALLDSVARGTTSIDQATDALRDLPFKDLGFAQVDHHRALRTGIPEVVFGAGKTLEQLCGIVDELARDRQSVLVTRVDEAMGRALSERFGLLRYDAVARIAQLHHAPIVVRGRGPIAILTGGTSDIPVAEEAAVTAEALGNDVTRVFDVGVAGLHRLLAKRPVLDAASVIIVVAGMEGALASVVGGLVDKPVIAVPTSIGYGASLGGIAALLTMLNSCAAGVTVVNIDNGFGAAYSATLINRIGAR